MLTGSFDFFVCTTLLFLCHFSITYRTTYLLAPLSRDTPQGTLRVSYYGLGRTSASAWLNYIGVQAISKCLPLLFDPTIA